MTTDPRELRERLQDDLGTTDTLERELGGGGKSRVFLAEERALGRRVVVKVLAPDIAHELSAERFAREIRLSSKLQHPNIVPVLSAGDAAGMPYYTMPFVDGASLRSRLAALPTGERLPQGAALEVLRDVARALSYAHSQGIVHRDIKPENVLLGFDAAVVADFGVAKAMAVARTQGIAPASTTLTHHGVMLGTPAYMSPEQAAGDPAVDHRADIYAWGILAYELLSGTHPFADQLSVQAMMAAHLVQQPRPLGEVAPSLPSGVVALVMRCLAKDPADRPATGRELIDTLTSGSARRQSPRLGPWAAALVLVTAAGWGINWLASRGTAPGASSTGSASAQDLYLRGRVRVSSENRQDNEAAVAALREAIAKDPELAPAYATLARALTINAFYFAADSEKRTLNEDAEVALAQALALDPNLAEAHFARGLMLWTPGRRFPHDQAVHAYQQALALDSTLDEAHHQLAIVFFHVGLLDRAEGEIEKALAINPGNTLARFRLGVISMYRGEYEQAWAIFNSTPLERNPALWAFQTATALFRLGRIEEATALIDRFLADYPKDEGGVGHSVRAMMLAKAGRRAEAEAAIATSLELGRQFGHFHHAAYNIASAYALIDDRDQAMRWLQEAADNGFPCYPLFAHDMQLDNLRADPRFMTMLAKLKRDQEGRQQSF